LVLKLAENSIVERFLNLLTFASVLRLGSLLILSLSRVLFLPFSTRVLGQVLFFSTSSCPGSLPHSLTEQRRVLFLPSSKTVLGQVLFFSTSTGLGSLPIHSLSRVLFYLPLKQCWARFPCFFFSTSNGPGSLPLLVSRVSLLTYLARFLVFFSLQVLA
jgi:hypothetical protein